MLTTLLAQTGGSYAEIDGYTAGTWSPSLFDDLSGGIGLSGSPFTLQLGQGYALYSDRAGSLHVTGTPAPAQAVPLAAGWDLVGFPDAGTNPIQADTFLTTLLSQTGGSYAEIDGYGSGQFTPSAFDDQTGGFGLGGTNFTAQSGVGYAVYTDRSTTQFLLVRPAQPAPQAPHPPVIASAPLRLARPYGLLEGRLSLPGR